MKIDKTLISRLETLAKLKLSEDEKEELANDLGNILTMVEKLALKNAPDSDGTYFKTPKVL